MSDYPDGPGFYADAPETSREAAESLGYAADNREAAALAVIASKFGYGATADEVAAACEWEKYSARPRISTLHANGKVVDSGKRRPGVSGRRQAVWVLPQFVTTSEEVSHVL